MAEQLTPTTIEQLNDGAPAQPANDYLAIRRENPAGSGKYEWDKLSVQDIQTSVLGNIRLSETFNGSALANGNYYLFGYYQAPAVHKAFSQAAATQTLGNASIMYSAHAFVVVSGVGSTDAGVVELRVSGTSVDDQGNRTTSDTELLIADITALAVTTNAYFQTSKKWLGQVTFTLQGSSGSPTIYSLTANYGFASYESAPSTGITVDTFSFNGHCAVTDGSNDFEVIIYKHPANEETTMTYSAAAFDPGGTEIFRLTDVISTDNQLVAASAFSFKRESINYSITDSSGFLVKIVHGTTNSIAYMNTTIGLI